MVTAAVFILTFAESLALVGAAVPATPMLLLLGGLLAAGTISPYAVIPPALVGAISGYWVSWILGRRYRSRIYSMKFFARRRRSVARVRILTRSYGGLILVVGRYVLGPLQSTVPLVAGAAGMAPSRFHRWNVLSGVLWVPIVLAPGYLSGKGLIAGQFASVLPWFAALLIAISLIGAVLPIMFDVFRRATSA
ncbi:VTT domain-containing protein [Sphingomonas sp. PvP056]|uniref:DedA family protein n=1 Tax=Sphingomonas sp. PvP056 TaxID=3156392 RepID=UPI0033925B46